MKSGFYCTKMKQKKSIKPLKVLFKYISPIFGLNFGKKSQWVGGIVSAAPILKSINKESGGSKNPEIMEMPRFDIKNNEIGILLDQSGAEKINKAIKSII